MDIGKKIRKLRKQAGMSQEELATKVDVSRAAVTQWETGWSQPRMGSIKKLAEVFGVSAASLINDDDLPQSIIIASDSEVRIPIRVLGHVHAGDVTDEEECERMVAIAPSVLEGHPEARALIVDGDCMNRVVLPGYVALYDPSMEPQNGKVVVAEVEAGRAVMRRWMRGSSTLMLVADSTEEYEDIVLKADEAQVRVLGVVFHACTPVWWEA